MRMRTPRVWGIRKSARQQEFPSCLEGNDIIEDKQKQPNTFFFVYVDYAVCFWKHT